MQLSKISAPEVSRFHSSKLGQNPKECNWIKTRLRRGLKQIQKDEQAARVRELKRKQLEFYKKQKVCETFSTISIISTFGCKYCLLYILGNLMLPQLL